MSTLLTSKEAAQLAGVDISRIRQLRADGTLDTVIRYGRKLVKRREVLAYMRRRTDARK